jgi:hypothetical protein
MSDAHNVPDEDSLEEQVGVVETRPNEAADPAHVVDAKVPADIRARYEVLSYRNAAVILAETRSAEMVELWDSLRSFTVTTEMIRKAGGNESQMPKLFSASLRPKGWHETVISADLVIRLTWREQVGVHERGKKMGKPKFESRERETRRDRYLDGHKIDYVKNRVAFDLEWNSKDQTFDRDLYAFNAFFLSGAIDVGVLVNRLTSLPDSVLSKCRRSCHAEFQHIKRRHLQDLAGALSERAGAVRCIPRCLRGRLLSTIDSRSRLSQRRLGSLAPCGSSVLSVWCYQTRPASGRSSGRIFLPDLAERMNVRKSTPSQRLPVPVCSTGLPGGEDIPPPPNSPWAVIPPNSPWAVIRKERDLARPPPINIRHGRRCQTVTY